MNRTKLGKQFPALYNVLTINSLDLNASRELVREILQNVSDLPRDLVETVAKNAEGNPFYLEELVKVLIEDGVIVKGEELWQIVPHSADTIASPCHVDGCFAGPS